MGPFPADEQPSTATSESGASVNVRFMAASSRRSTVGFNDAGLTGCGNRVVQARSGVYRLWQPTPAGSLRVTLHVLPAAHVIASQSGPRMHVGSLTAPMSAPIVAQPYPSGHLPVLLHGGPTFS